MMMLMAGMTINAQEIVLNDKGAYEKKEVLN